jgi:hypothetical protein
VVAVVDTVAIGADNVIGFVIRSVYVWSITSLTVRFLASILLNLYADAASFIRIAIRPTGDLD